MKMDEWNIRRRRFLTAAISASAASLLMRTPLNAMSRGNNMRMRNFRQRKFGMFVHWGPYSQASVEASWPIMVKRDDWPITVPEYQDLATTFNPVNFDPDEWLDLARAAGHKYMVFTTKHHDGYCMFDTLYSDYKITKSPYGKDIVKMLSDACAKRDFPLGFYYSPPDMNHPGFRDMSKPTYDSWHGQPERAEWSSYLDYMELQLSELLTRYGTVDTIWFDGLWGMEKYNGQRFIDLIHRLQPATTVNNRIGTEGDYGTPEQFIPQHIPRRGIDLTGTDPKRYESMSQEIPAIEDFMDWEVCMTINDTWAYNVNDHKYKSADELIRSSVEIFSRGGNFLLNIGPRPDGTIQPEFRERMLAMGKWMSINGEAVYDTLYGPVQNQEGYRTTARENHVFVHVLDWPKGKLNVRGWGKKIASVQLLSDKRPLPFVQNDDGIVIDVAGVKPDSAATVIKVSTV